MDRSSSSFRFAGDLVTTVGDLSKYSGSTIAEQIESMISSEQVVMFNRSWCLFSHDAIAFLSIHLKVQVHSVELDKTDKGNEIFAYLKKKTKHSTTPMVFLNGNFVGGYEELQGLYCTGALERDHLHVPEHKALPKKKSLQPAVIRPLFWFPNTVDAYTTRFMAAITSSLCLASACLSWMLVGRVIAYVLLSDFALRFFFGAKFSPIGQLGKCLTYNMEKIPKSGRAKQFAAACGLFCTLLASVIYTVDFPGHAYAGAGIMGMVSVLAFMESTFDFCVACVMFRIGINLGLIPI